MRQGDFVYVRFLFCNRSFAWSVLVPHQHGVFPWFVSFRHSFTEELPWSLFHLLVLVLKNPVPYCIFALRTWVALCSYPLEQKGFMLHTWAAQSGFIIIMTLKIILLLIQCRGGMKTLGTKTLWCFEGACADVRVYTSSTVQNFTLALIPMRHHCEGEWLKECLSRNPKCSLLF